MNREPSCSQAAWLIVKIRKMDVGGDDNVTRENSAQLARLGDTD